MVRDGKYSASNWRRNRKSEKSACCKEMYEPSDMLEIFTAKPSLSSYIADENDLFWQWRNSSQTNKKKN